MRNRGLQIGATKQAARGAADRAYRDQVRTLQPKFQPGADPLEREAGIKILEPTDAQQLQQMTKMLEKLYEGGTPQEQQALELWKMQVAQGTIRDQVKLDFMRRFYFWLLGRGDQADHDKTLWGRANTAVYNKEVASYIDMFVDKRTKYVMKLRALANNVPDTLNGMYLYYKYIVNGQLKQVRAADGTITYEMSDEDYLQDFDLFQQVFDSTIGVNGRHGGGKVGYSELAAGLPTNGTRARAFDSAGVPAPINNSGLSSSRASDVSLNASKMEENNTIGVRDRLSLGSGREKDKRPARDSRSWEQRRSIGGTIEATAVPNPGDLSSGSVDVSGPPEELGQASQEVRSLGGDDSFIGNDPNVSLAQTRNEQEIRYAYEEEEDLLQKRGRTEDYWNAHARRLDLEGKSTLAEAARKEAKMIKDKYGKEGKGKEEMGSMTESELVASRIADENRRLEFEAAEARAAKAAARGRPSKSEDSKVLEIATEIAANPVAVKSLATTEVKETVKVLAEIADRLSKEGKNSEARKARTVAAKIIDAGKANLEAEAKKAEKTNPKLAAALREVANELKLTTE